MFLNISERLTGKRISSSIIRPIKSCDVDTKLEPRGAFEGKCNLHLGVPSSRQPHTPVHCCTSVISLQSLLKDVGGFNISSSSK